MLRIAVSIVAMTLMSGAPAHADVHRSTRPHDAPVDLEGVWAHTNLTPLERPNDLTSLVITPAEAAAFEGKLNARNDDLSRPAEPSLYFDSRHIEAIDGELRSSVIIDPPNGKVPGNDLFKKIIGEARAQVLTAFDGPEQRPGAERCLSAPSAAPPISVVPAGDLRQIVQTRDAILIHTEELHEARVIRMNAKHAPAAVVSWLGDSIGWWEGETLVIETTHFTPSSSVRMSPNSMFLVSPKTVVTERITRVSSDELRYTFTVEDPTFYTQPWRGETRLHRSSAPMLEYACHEGNYSLGYALQGRDGAAPASHK